MVDGKDCSKDASLRPSPDGTGVQKLCNTEWESFWSDDTGWYSPDGSACHPLEIRNDYKLILGYEHTDGRRFYDGDRVSGYIYDGLGPDYGDLFFANAMVKFDTNEGQFIVVDTTRCINSQYLGDLWGALVNGEIGLVE